MHRDVKPHNVMIDHEKRTVSSDRSIRSDVGFVTDMLPFIAASHRLGIGGILSSWHRVQCPSCFKILQGPGVVGGFPGIRLQLGHVEFGLHVCQYGMLRLVIPKLGAELAG